ncbi:MAG: hypothetical protein R2774_01490 [Saprospiraceae bacterium]
MYNPSIGKFLSVDPLTKSYPMLTPYQFASNTPIQAIDLDGLEAIHYTLAKAGVYGETVASITKGTEDGVKASLKGSWDFLTRDAWKADTWKGVYSFYEEVMDSYNHGMTGAGATSYPMLDQMAKNFELEVIDGDSYSRSKFISEFSTNVVTAYISSKGLGSVKSFASNVVKTPYSIAKQSLSIRSLAGAVKAKQGATLYRIGTEGISVQGPKAQFWALENPLENPEKFAKDYNVPLENIKNANFIETAVLKKDANFITREAGQAPGSLNTGTGIEVVVEQGGTINNVIEKIIKK